MTTPLFVLRCKEIGLSLFELAELSIGFVLDMWTEKSNDDAHYDTLASQDDFDRF